MYERKIYRCKLTVLSYIKEAEPCFMIIRWPDTYGPPQEICCPVSLGLRGVPKWLIRLATQTDGMHTSDLQK